MSMLTEKQRFAKKEQWLKEHEKKLQKEGVCKREGDILVFKDREELKWWFHAQLCKGDSFAEFLMERCVDKDALRTVKDVNEWLTENNLKVRVKEK